MMSLPPTYVEGFHDLEAVKAMKYKTLGKSGLIVSQLSLGGGPLGIHYGSYDENEVISMIREAIKKGVNYIDTGYWYGQGRSEAVIGKALSEVPRQAYYIATKVGRYELDFKNMFDFSIETTRKSIQRSLDLLQLDYVDVIQVHDIEFAPSLDIIISQTLPELSKQVSKGRARFIGITGYPVSVLKECIDKSNINISCILSYCRNTIIDNTLEQYVPYFKEQNIGIISASSPCMGLLTNKGPPVWHPADEVTKKLCAQAAEYCKDHGVELAKLSLWHAMQTPDICTHLVGMQSRSELESHLQCVTQGISAKEKQVLQDVKEKYFLNAKNIHWEGKEVSEYRAALEKY